MAWLNVSRCQAYFVFGQMAYCLGFHFLKDLFKKPPLFNLVWKIQFNQRSRIRAQRIQWRGGWVCHMQYPDHNARMVTFSEHISFAGSA